MVTVHFNNCDDTLAGQVAVNLPTMPVTIQIR